MDTATHIATSRPTKESNSLDDAHRKSNKIKFYACKSALFGEAVVAAADPPDTKIHECLMCDFKSIHEFQLKKHILTHTRELTYSCSNNMCNYETNRKDRIQQHLKTHEGENPDMVCSIELNMGEKVVKKKREKKPKKVYYKCDICEHISAHPSQLKKHLRIHTGERPYKCDLCDYRAVQSSHMKHHKRTHTGERPYKCDICNFDTARATSLKVHNRIHTGEKPYQCAECDYRTAQSDSLRKHVLRKHKNMTT